VTAGSTSAPAPTARSSRSSSTASTAVRPGRPRRANCSTTPTFAVPATSIEEVLLADPSDHRQLHQLGLAGMARAFAELQANPQSTALSHAEWLSLLLDREATERYDRPLRARLRFARLRQNAVVEDVDYRTPRGLDRAPVPETRQRRVDRRARQSDPVRPRRDGDMMR
jgi:IstB-like ATP binding protein